MAAAAGSGDDALLAFPDIDGSTVFTACTPDVTVSKALVDLAKRDRASGAGRIAQYYADGVSVTIGVKLTKSWKTRRTEYHKKKHKLHYKHWETHHDEWHSATMDSSALVPLQVSPIDGSIDPTYKDSLRDKCMTAFAGSKDPKAITDAVLAKVEEDVKAKMEEMSGLKPVAPAEPPADDAAEEA